MKIINLSLNETTYLIEDGGKHYCLERVRLDDNHPVRLVLAELDEDELTNLVRKCKAAK